MATTSKQIIAAARDEDLRERFIAIAAALGIASPEHWVDLRLRALVAVDLDGPGPADESVAKAYDYKLATYEPAPRPGEDMAAVTDALIFQAIIAVATAEANSQVPGGAQAVQQINPLATGIGGS